jgi:cytochrome c553
VRCSPLSVRVAVALAASACAGQLEPVGTSDGGPLDAPLSPEAAAARAAFTADVAPLLSGFCASCHTTDVTAGFLEPEPDVYTSVMAWPGLVNTTSPSASRLLAKGVHLGPAWSVEQAVTIRRWIDLEAAADTASGGGDDELETAIVTIATGPAEFPLDELGLPGAKVTLTAERLAVGLYLSRIAVTAGPDGVHLAHPIVVSWDGDDIPTPDPVDSFDQVDLDVPAGATAPIGGGLLVMLSPPPSPRLSIHFRVLSRARGDTPTPMGGCRAVPSFTANARGPLAASCASCHAGGQSGATNATDLRALGDLSPTSQAAACGQVLSRVNLANANASGLFIAVDPAGGANHPFKFGGAAAFTNFRAAVTTWIQAEAAAAGL